MDDDDDHPRRPERRPRRIREAAPVVGTARVIEMVGKWVRVRDDSGVERSLPVRAEVVTGDRVSLRQDADMCVVSGFEPRRTELRRGGNSGVRVVCANADVLVMVSASLDPPFRSGLVDRMLVAASAAGMTAALVLNKCDAGMPEAVLGALAFYEDLGVPVFMVSALQSRNLEGLQAFLKDKTSVLAGHSGVGKSSLLRALIPGVARGVGDVDHWGRGRHTTTGACAFDLPGGGVLVDLPGVREYGVGFVLRRELREHFIELRGLGCRYADCLHDGEDGCVAEDHCDEGRLESYRKLLEECL